MSEYLGHKEEFCVHLLSTYYAPATTRKEMLSTDEVSIFDHSDSQEKADLTEHLGCASLSYTID